MRKQFILLTGGVWMLAACGSDNNNAVRAQVQIDSIVNAKMAKHDAENAAKNDSTLKAIEKEKADAITKERSEEKKQEAHAGNNAGANAPAPAPVQTVSTVNNRPGAQAAKPADDRPGAH